VSAFQPYRRSDRGLPPATLATFATVHVPEPRNVASVGLYSAQAKAERREARATIRLLRELLDTV
jgi:hypothetical protein